MRSVIVVSPTFDRTWPFAADHFHSLWKKQGGVEFIRLPDEDDRLIGEMISNPESVDRMVALCVSVSLSCLKTFTSLKEAVFSAEYGNNLSEECVQYLDHAGVHVYTHPSEGFWGQSVSEFALGLTICGLRRIPQTHHNILTSLDEWDYEPPNGKGRPGIRGHQFGDDARFTNGTVEGKRIRIIGAGNIASRYASFVHTLGADVAAWDPFASEPSFHRAGARREYYLDELIRDADIFVPMVPLTNETKGLVTEKHIEALPEGCLVVLATRAGICDMTAIRKRVLADELSLAADVFDTEPLPLDDPLLGRENVVHTPHNAGRTIDANKRWAESLAGQFRPVSSNRSITGTSS